MQSASVPVAGFFDAGEYPVSQDEVLISRTDTKGRITYLNEAFVRVSGYEASELLGQAHRVVRHPQMPRTVFADMWKTLQSGAFWTGVIKNLRKDGRHYWVRAYVAPYHRDGRLEGYISVRAAPSRQEIAEAETLYAHLDAGTRMLPDEARQHARGARYTVVGGRPIRNNWAARAWIRLATRPIGERLALCCAFLTAVGAAALAALHFEVPAWSQVLLGALVLATPWIGVLYLRSQLVKPMQGLETAARRALQGERVAFEESGDASMRELIGALNQMQMRSKGVLCDLKEHVVRLTEIAQRMQGASESLSATCEQQSASASTVANSVNGVVDGVRQTAGQSASVCELAEKASKDVQRGDAAAREVRSTFSGISDANRGITEMLGKVSDIAFQTHLLALNASIEAAQAGEHGVGFAVIATEIRALAANAKELADHIGSLNEATSQRVQQAERAVTHLDDAVKAIEKSFREVGALAQEVAGTTATQSEALAHAASALAEMDSATNHTATLAESTANTANEVRERVQRMREAA